MMNFRSARILRLLIAAVLSSALPAAASADSPIEILTSFTSTTGSNPLATVIRDDDGVLFGTTATDGDKRVCGVGCGSIYSLTPPAPGKTAWKRRILHIFSGNPKADGGGSFPLARLYLDKSGALFGTAFNTAEITATDGKSNKSGNNGLVFKLTPPPVANGNWSYQVIHTFSGKPDDGASPSSGVIASKDGALYGTTDNGGSDNEGTVYKLTPPANPGGTWTAKVIHSFVKKTGVVPVGGLVMDADGNLYGTSQSGGSHDVGNVWRLTPPAPGKNAWHFDVLHNFNGTASDGSFPLATLLLREGVLFGTTSRGGNDDAGIVFSVTLPTSPSGRADYKVLHHFIGATEGLSLESELVADGKGQLYGNAVSGSSGGFGSLFRLSPPKPPSKDWKLKILYRFQDTPDASFPRGGLVRANGVLFGAGQGGGTRGRGSVFSFKP